MPKQNDPPDPLSPDATDEPSSAEPLPESSDAGELTAERASEAEDLAATRDRLLRLAAEFDNYRKRVEREKGDSWTRAQGQLAERLLEPLDDLQRFTSADPATLSAEAALEGLRLVERKLSRALEAAGLEPVEAEGQRFDPSVHEALGTVNTGDREAEDSVADVFQRGYRFKGALLRPARVRVHRYGE